MFLQPKQICHLLHKIILVPYLNLFDYFGHMFGVLDIYCEVLDLYFEVLDLYVGTGLINLGIGLMVQVLD